MKKNAALTLLLTVAFLFGLAVPAHAAPSITCGSTGTRTYGWVTSPIAGQKVGTRHCRTMTLGSLNGEYAYWFRSADGTWIPTSNNAPNRGGAPGTAGRAHADAARALAARHGLTLHFVRYSGADDRVGYLRRDGAIYLRGTYYPSPQRPGRGLIEISAGGGPLGLADPVRGNKFVRTMILDMTRHEVAHGDIEEECGTWNPPIAGTRIEHVTDAYAITFLGKTKTSYGYTASDVRKARAIRAGNCG